MRYRVFLFLIITISLAYVAPVLAQTPQGSGVCVFTYHDANQNGQHEETEQAFSGVAINIKTPDNIIVASHISNGDVYCMNNLPAGMYEVVFEESPNHIPTTANNATVEIVADGQPALRLEYGLQPDSPFFTAEEAAEMEASTRAQLDSMTRILVAVMAAVFVMIFMVGFGAVIISVIS
jgi:hypothetical protein